MALQSQFLCSFTTNVGRSVLLLCPTQTSLRIRSRKVSSSSSEPSNLEDSASSAPPPKKPGVGFGSSNSNETSAAAAAATATATTRSSKKKQKKSRRERASIIRRTPLEKPPFASEQEKEGKGKEESKNESAFILAWLGFGAVILVEGISLAASGFLPEEWDKLFVKYLYPSFTPTVFLFVAGAVAYGVYKYLQNEKITDQK